jgi:hypothetical protein
MLRESLPDKQVQVNHLMRQRPWPSILEVIRAIGAPSEAGEDAIPAAVHRPCPP